MVDTLGLILAVAVPAASTEDRHGLVVLLTQYCAAGVKRLRQIWGDGASPAAWLAEWVRSLQQTPTIDLEATPHKDGRAFQAFLGAGQWSARSPGCSMTVAIVGTMKG